MTLRLVLLRDNEVLWEMPLYTSGWLRSELDEELEELENDFDKLSIIFDALSNKNRLLMMKTLLEEEEATLHFSDLMRELKMNPKVVRESAVKLRSGGFLKQPDRGEYKCSQTGQISFFTITLALRRLLNSLEELE